MAHYLLRRLGFALFSIWAVCTLVFFAAYLAPGDPVEIAAGQHSDPAVIARVRHEYGLDRPPLARYGLYLWKAMHGDLGKSFYTREPVTAFFARTVGPTATLATVAMLFAVLVGVPMGLVAALRPGSWWDRLLMTAVLVGVTLPAFVLGPVLVIVVALKLNWLPASGWTMSGSSLAPDNWPYLALPAFVLGMRPLALIARMTRSSVIEILRQDYIRAARAKGLHPWTILWKHTLRNAALPVLSVAGVSFGYLLTGSFVVETMFRVPGMGFTSINSLSTRDYSLVQGCAMLMAVVFITVNLLVDLLYAALDPRVKITRYSERRMA